MTFITTSDASRQKGTSSVNIIGAELNEAVEKRDCAVKAETNAAIFDCEKGLGIADDLSALLASRDLAGLVAYLRRIHRGGAVTLFLGGSKACLEISNAILSAVGHLESMVVSAKTSDGRGSQLLPEVLEVLEAYGSKERAAIFVYGTLLSGMPASGMLAGCGFAGSAVAEGAYMYDLGSYPAISDCPMHECAPLDGPRWGIEPGVRGEVRLCDASAIRRLNRYEGEGELYDLKPIRVVSDAGEPVDAYAYFYRFEEMGVEEMPEGSFVPLSMQPYDRLSGLKDTHVWYVAYGSNILFERFACYVAGGTCPQNGRTYAGCRDRSMPIASVAFDIDHDIYFGNESGSWGGSGAAFLDTGKPGHAIGRAYLVTREQLEDVHAQEGPGDHWYPDVVRLGEIAGIPAVTLINSARRQPNAPSGEYLDVMRRGLEETLWGACDFSAEAYFERIKKSVAE